MKTELKPKPPMLDPTWTPERGYSHAHDLMRIIREAEAKKKGGK